MLPMSRTARTAMESLVCRECKRSYPLKALFVCEYCFGPLEIRYDYAKAAKTLTRDSVAKRPLNLWRYRELLPVESEPQVGLHSGFTPLIKGERLAEALGVKEIYIKDDTVNHPTLSYKDRVVSISLSRAIELGFQVVGCASTGNLAHAVAAHAAIAGMEAYIFIPEDLELGKIVSSLVYAPRLIKVKGNYDQVNRLCTEIVSKYPWAFVNVNLRPYYTEGAKTAGFEILEQLNWKAPQHLVLPVAGGTLLPKVRKSLVECYQLGLIDSLPTKIYAAQAAGSSPVVNALHAGKDIIDPVKPETIAKSLAIGNPADGYYALQAVRETHGFGEKVTDEEIVKAMQLLAETEGIFAETAGGVTLGAAIKLIEQGRIPRDESIVIAITGNGLKTQEAVQPVLEDPPVIEPTLQSFEDHLTKEGK